LPRHRAVAEPWRLVLAALLLLWNAAAAQAEGRAGAFDYYMLALSWSPTYCASPAGRDDAHQCGSARRYDFVVHGLWPQYRDGWPQYCDSDAYLSDALVDAMLDIMPSRRLVRHQWNKHGTCTGLAPEDYFALTRRLHDEITVPARYIDPGATVVVSLQLFVDDFLATNRDLSRGMMSVQCGNRRDRARLRELRICFTRDGALGDCGANERRQCRADALVLPPVR
jgi:ribonuclease T2